MYLELSCSHLYRFWVCRRVQPDMFPQESVCNLLEPGGSVPAEPKKIGETMKNTVELNETNFDQEVLKANGLVVVDFYAPWCGPCRMLAPFFEQLAAEFAGRAKFVKVNVDDAPLLATRYGITGVPTVMLFKGGVLVDTYLGVPSPKQFRARIDALADKALATTTA